MVQRGRRGGCGRVVLEGYVFELDRVFDAVVKQGARRVVVEAPQGLVRLLPRLVDTLLECLPRGVSVESRLEPSYGLCSLSLSHAGDAVLVHVGHDYYPYPYCWSGGCVGIERLTGGRIVLLRAEYVGGDAERLAKGVAGAAGSEGVVVAATSQHAGLAARIAELLRSMGVRVLGLERVVGCYFAGFRRYAGRGVLFAVVAGGFFHALGVGLYFAGSERVAAVDPYSGRVSDVGGLVGRVLAKRYWVVRLAWDAERIGVIVGDYPGQYRPGIVDAILRLAERRGRRAYVLRAGRVTVDLLDNIAPGLIDAYVVTSCPRLAIEDFSDYWKPVLTPGEARMALNRVLDRYLFPW